MDGSVVDLSKYRLERSKDDLETAESNLKDHRYSASVNRAYYAIFHALRAITALDQFDSGRHSGIIAYINYHYVKTGIFDKQFSKLIDASFRLREKADYEDFYVVTNEEAQFQLEKSKAIVSTVEAYLITRWTSAE